MLEEESNLRLQDELRGQYKKNKHHLAKVFIAIVAIPLTTILLDSYVFSESTSVYLSMLMSSWATYILITIYDGVIIRETQRAKRQIVRNTLSILVIEEDVRDLQKEVYQGEKQVKREENYVKAMRRKGETYMGGDIDGRSS